MKKNSYFSDDEFFNNFINLDLKTKEKVEKRAIEIYIQKNDVQNNFLLKMKKSSPTIFYNSLKNTIIEVMKKNIDVEQPEKPKKEITVKKRGRRKKLDMVDELDKTKEVEKNEKTIKSFMKKKYGKEKMMEMINSSQNYEELMFEEYINFLKEKEKNK